LLIFFVLAQVRHKNLHAPGRVMCTARPSWRSMTIAEMTYKKRMFNINVYLDEMISIDSHNRVSDYRILLLIGIRYSHEIIIIAINNNHRQPTGLILFL